MVDYRTKQEEMIAWAKDIGITQMGTASLGGRVENGTVTMDAVKGASDEYNKFGEVAAKAGIQQGDVIVKFNNHDVRDEHELPALVAQTGIGGSVEVELIRDGKHKTIGVTIGELKEAEIASARSEEPGSDWGMQVANNNPDIARQLNLPTDKGVVIKGVRPDTPAADDRLEPGDIVLEVNHEKVATVDDFVAKAKDSKKSGRPALLLVQRGNASLYAVIKSQGQG